MNRFQAGVLVSAIALGIGGCTMQGRGSGGFEATSDPMLVELSAGVWVIEDYDEPVFYADGFYWLYRDDGWYRSSFHTGGWARSQSVPQVVVRIETPRTYVHYHAPQGVRVRNGPRGNAIVRDHRDDRSSPARTPRPEEPVTRPPPPDRGPANMPDKQEKRDDKQDRREDRQQDKRDDKQDKRDDKQDRRDDKQDKRDDKRDDKQDKRDDKQDKRDDKKGDNQGQRKQK